ncbi:unnamed protein product [Mytilus coruscus]|uniref:C-type lectin domain-containing protein n=1 Tax=Mytilus coruscus TaxID=42192 RepID=A0A6J8BVM9_MYTCO|nr:unnamed protein product [Mytilus coruscus]
MVGCILTVNNLYSFYSRIGNVLSFKDYYIVGSKGFATWSTAMYTCLRNNGSFSKNEDDFRYYWDYWLRYFKYEEDKANEQCVAIIRNDNSLPLTYQFRPCSDRLPVLCNDSNFSSHIITPVFVNRGSLFSGDSKETIFGRNIDTTLTNNSDVQRLGVSNDEIDLCIRIIAGGAAFFATIIIFLLVIVYIQRRKLIKVYFTSLITRRDENSYNEIPNQRSDTITEEYYDEVVPLSEIPVSECPSTVQQNIEHIQSIDTAGYPIISSILETSEGHYQTIAD